MCAWLDGFELLQVPFEAARTRAQLSTVESPESAGGLLAAARSTFERLGIPR